MQSWQLISFGLVAVVFIYAFKMRGKLGAKAAEMHSGAMEALRTELATGREPDEGDPICFQAVERKMLSAKIFYVALTKRRLVIKLGGGATRSFDRQAVQMAMRAKTFADVGNMQTTYSRGWELKLALPDGTKHTWRVYDQADGLSDHSSHVQALVHTLSAS
jgi:hypothetical protein